MFWIYFGCSGRLSAVFRFIVVATFRVFILLDFYWLQPTFGGCRRF